MQADSRLNLTAAAITAARLSVPQTERTSRELIAAVSGKCAPNALDLQRLVA